MIGMTDGTWMLLGNTWQQWLLAIAITVVTFLALRPLRWPLERAVRAATKQSNAGVGQKLIDDLRRPLGFLFAITGVRFGLHALTLSVPLDRAVERGFGVLVIVAATVLLGRLLRLWLLEFSVRYIHDHDLGIDPKMVPPVGRVVTFVVWLLGGLMALDNAGFDVYSLIAGLGIGGLAIALAAQKTLSNIISGLSIVLDQPFRVGQWITVNGETGKVIDITWRTTRIQTFANATLHIPNDTVASAQVLNWDQHIDEFGVGYFIFQKLSFHPHHDPEKIVRLLTEAIDQTPAVDGRDKLGMNWVKFIEVDRHGMTFGIVFDCTDRLLKNTQENLVLQSIHRVLRREGISIVTGEFKGALETDPGLDAAPQLPSGKLEATLAADLAQVSTPS